MYLLHQIVVMSCLKLMIPNGAVIKDVNSGTKTIHDQVYFGNSLIYNSNSMIASDKHHHIMKVTMVMMVALKIIEIQQI